MRVLAILEIAYQFRNSFKALYQSNQTQLKYKWFICESPKEDLSDALDNVRKAYRLSALNAKTF